MKVRIGGDASVEEAEAIARAMATHAETAVEVYIGDADGDAWHVWTDCGAVDATLTVEGIREADLDVGVIASEYAQPLGAWSRTVAGHRVEGVGVAERHRARW